jgi:hypothetical protein
LSVPDSVGVEEWAAITMDIEAHIVEAWS